MYLTLGQLLAICSTVFACTLLSAFVVFSRIAQRYSRIQSEAAARHESEIEAKHREVTEHKLAIQKIIYDTHHQGLNPLFKTMLGLVNLVRLVVPSDSPALEFLDKLEELIKKYEIEWMNRIKPFEHLQE